MHQIFKGTKSNIIFINYQLVSRQNLTYVYSINISIINIFTIHIFDIFEMYGTSPKMHFALTYYIITIDYNFIHYLRLA